MAKKNNQKNQKFNNSSLSLEIGCIIAICISILLIISVFFGGGGFVGKFFSSTLKGLLGVGAYILPMLLIACCIIIFFSEKNKINFFKFIMTFVLVLLAMTFLHIATKDNLNSVSYGHYLVNVYKNGSVFNGGVFGALLGDLLTKILGKVFTYILIVFTFFVFVILLTEKSFFNMLKNGFTKLSRYFSYEYNFKDDEEEIEQEFDIDYQKESIFSKTTSYFKQKIAGIKQKKAQKELIETEEKEIQLEPFDKSDVLKPLEPLEPIEYAENKVKPQKRVVKKYKNYIFDGEDKYKKVKKPIIFEMKKSYEPSTEQKILFAIDEINSAKLNSYSKNSIASTEKEALPKFFYNEISQSEKGEEPLFNIKRKENFHLDALSTQDFIQENEFKMEEVQKNLHLKTENENKNCQSQVGNSETIAQTEKYDTGKEDNPFYLGKVSDNYFSYIDNLGKDYSKNEIEGIVIDYDIPTHTEIEELFSRPPEHFLSDEADLSSLDKLDDFYDFENNTDQTETTEETIENTYESKDDEQFETSLNYTKRYEDGLAELEEEIEAEEESPKLNPNQDNKAINQESEINQNHLNNPQAEMKNQSDFSHFKHNEPYIERAEKQKILSELILDESSKSSAYQFPKLDFLSKNSNLKDENSDMELKENSSTLVKTLKSFNVNSEVIKISKGPSVTRYELAIEDGIKVSKILGLDANLALSLAATSIRIEAPIPGKSAVGIEIPNKEVKSVFLSEVICSEKFQKFNSKVSFGLGKDITGNVIVTDIAKMPHMLIAGATGSGKSVCINTLITSILYKANPNEVKLIMIDPKVVELSVYNNIPHLLLPVVTEPEKASGTLNWAVQEMMERYNLFAAAGVRNIAGYNDIMEKNNQSKLPQIVIIIDELADLMMVAAKEVENAICRLAQLARAAGMHLIIATQRPSVDVITGLIKANIPSRIAFAVSSGTDSRTVLDSVGAEKLLGKGDMLFKAVDMSKPLRIQGAFISDKEVENIVNFIKSNSEPNYDQNIINKIESATKSSETGNSELSDELTDDVISFLVRKGKASTSLLQRQFRIGYNRAARIIEELEDRGIIASENGSKQREVLMDKYQFEEYLNRKLDDY